MAHETYKGTGRARDRNIQATISTIEIDTDI